MRTKKLFFLLLLSIPLLEIYSQDKGFEWNSIEYLYDIGSLPPIYHYEYIIKINRDGKGIFTYQMGYSQIDSNILKYEFELTESRIYQLNNEINISGVLSEDIQSVPNSEIPIGGDSEILKIFLHRINPNADAGLDTKEIPSYPEKKFRKKLNKLYQSIKDCVPQYFWDDSKQQRENRINQIKD